MPIELRSSPSCAAISAPLVHSSPACLALLVTLPGFSFSRCLSAASAHEACEPATLRHWCEAGTGWGIMRTVLLSPSTVQRSLQTAWAVRSSVCVPRLFPGRAVSARRATTTRAEGDRGAWCACATRAGTLSPLARLSLPRPVAGLVPRMQVHVHPVPDLQEIGGAELQAPAAAVPRHAGGWEPVHGDEEGGEAALGVCEGRHRGRWAAVVHVAGEGAPGLSGLRARRARCAAVRDLPSPRPPQVNFALSASELGKIIDLPLDGSVSFIHSPETGVTKTLTLRPLVVKL